MITTNSIVVVRRQHKNTDNLSKVLGINIKIVVIETLDITDRIVIIDLEGNTKSPIMILEPMIMKALITINKKKSLIIELIFTVEGQG